MSQYFDHALAVTDLETGYPLCVANNGNASGLYNVAGYVVTPAAAEQLAAFHKDVTMALPWDGLYVDEFDAAFPPSWISTFADQSSAYDINNDGIADTLGDLQAQYAAFKPYFSQKLREAIGEDKLLIANSGTNVLGDASLNGITIESEDCPAPARESRVARIFRGDVAWIFRGAVDSRAGCDGSHGTPCPESEIETGYEICAAAFEGQALVGRAPRLSVLWHTHDYVIPAQAQCDEVRRFREDVGDFVLDGDDFSDGSWNATDLCPPA